MRFSLLLAFLWFTPSTSFARSDKRRGESPPPPEAGVTSHWIAPRPVHVYLETDEDSGKRGLIASNEPFEVLGPAEGRHCGAPGWAKVRGNGFACLETASPTDQAPQMLPRFVNFPHPDSKENDAYKETGEYDLNPEGPYPNSPFIYARRYKEKKGRAYKSPEAYENGESSIYRIGGTKSFVGVVDTERGKVLVRRNGHVVPMDDVKVVALSRLESRNVVENPLPDGMMQAWTIRKKGTRVRAEPNEDAEVIKTIDYHTAILIRDESASKSGRWWEIPDAGGPGVPGYVQDRSGIRHWVPSPPPDFVRDDELWIDVDLNQQVLALRRGATLEYLTMVSTGTTGHTTPRGLYQIKDKTIYANMASGPSAPPEKQYFVGNVPWIIHFWPRYAIHGAFWHYGFGWVRSHGCVNMTLHDVRFIYENIDPKNYPGWQYVYANKDDPGTLLRIRRGQGEVVDRRRWK